MDRISLQTSAGSIDYTDPAVIEQELIKLEAYYESFTLAMLVCFTDGEAN
jgi:hypothetical protein